MYKASKLDSIPVVYLNEKVMDKNPFDQFVSWFKEAVDAGITEPYTMAMATATKDGKPSVRMLLLKEIKNNDFVFFSNYKSRKGRELDENNKAALLFYWQQINRQVRIEGIVTKLPKLESDKYFQTRSRESQINAWVSKQSEILESREALENKRVKLEKRFINAPIPCPPYWGGYRLRPKRIEFWQRIPNRFHDRIVYQQDEKGIWTISRLFP